MYPGTALSTINKKQKIYMNLKMLTVNNIKVNFLHRKIQNFRSRDILQ